MVKKEGKSKEELAELRRAMMKSKVKRKENNFGCGASNENVAGGNDLESKQLQKKDPK